MCDIKNVYNFLSKWKWIYIWCTVYSQFCKYSWLLNNMGLNRTGALIHEFFSVVSTTILCNMWTAQSADTEEPLPKSEGFVVSTPVKSVRRRPCWLEREPREPGRKTETWSQDPKRSENSTQEGVRRKRSAVSNMLPWAILKMALNDVFSWVLMLVRDPPLHELDLVTPF